MRTSDRIKPTLELLEQFWKKYPDLRLGQLMMVIANTGETNPGLFYMEDDEFIRRLQERKNQLDNS